MPGNRLGWSIAGLIVLIQAAVVFWALSLDKLTEPTEMTSQGSLARIEIPVAWTQVVPDGVAGDSGAMYRDAVRLIEADDSMLHAVVRENRDVPLDQLPAVRLIVDAGSMKRSPVFEADFERVVTYDVRKMPIEHLRLAGDAAIRLGMLRASRDPAGATRLLEAAFLLGASMYQERLVYDQLVAGLGLMGDAAAGLGQIAGQGGDASRIERIDAFDRSRADYVKAHILPIRTALWAVDRDRMGRHAGDVFAFARTSAERMWRVEAVLQVGRMRFDMPQGHRADQLGIPRLLARIESDDSDPVVRHAVRLARDLTVERFRMIR
jgi:hypothetical protein